METSLKTGFAQIFSCCPKNLSCPNFGGAAAPLAPPARTPKILNKKFLNLLALRRLLWSFSFHVERCISSFLDPLSFQCKLTNWRATTPPKIELSRIQPILRFDVIPQHDWSTEQCLLHIRDSLAGKQRVHVFIFSSIG